VCTETAHSCAMRNERKTDDEYILVNTKCLKKFLSDLSCLVCSEKLEFSIGDHHGFATKLYLKCNACEIIKCSEYSSVRLSDLKSTRPPFEINQLMVSAFLGLGVGHSGITRFGATVGMNTLTSGAYTKHLKVLSEEVLELKKNSEEVQGGCQTGAL